VIDVDTAIQDFDKMKFWREKFRELTCYRPRTNDIHHPTLRFMHKWLGFSIFPRNGFHTIRNDEHKLLYTMAKTRKVLPVQFMTKQWKEIPNLKGDIGCTSLVTRIAKQLGLLENAFVAYIDDIPRCLIDYEYFNQDHRLKKGKNRKLVMMYMDYTNKIPIPDQNLGLYAV